MELNRHREAQSESHPRVENGPRRRQEEEGCVSVKEEVLSEASG